MVYEFIKVFAEDLHNLKFKVISKTSLKSNHYWLMAIIPKLTHLKHLTIYSHVNKDMNVPQDFWKFLEKAMKYFAANKLSLDSFSLVDVQNQNRKDFLYSILKYCPDIKVLTMTHTQLNRADCKGIGKVLSDFKFIKELNLENCGLTNANQQEIADGLMRAKQLEILRINDNQSLNSN